MIYTINNCIRAFGYTNFDKLIADMGSVDNLKAYVIANGYADIAVAEDTELLLVDVNGKTWHTGCYGAVIEPPKPYLCFTSTGDSTVAMTQRGTPNKSANKVIQYKLNNDRWQTWDLSAVTLHDGDKMYLKSDDEIPVGELYNIYKYFVMSGSIAASGNIMSLLNFSTTLAEYGLTCLFRNCTSLTQAPELPATTLSSNCYASMFDGCTSLTTAPELPATTLSSNCYASMFQGCTSLTTAPELPATTLAQWCYISMFSSCTSLTQAPELPATTLAASCYQAMFSGCTSLVQAPELPVTTLAASCYQAMFSGCVSLTTAPELPATDLQPNCYASMFRDCKSLTTAPALHATTLAESCYYYMFFSCPKLNYVKAMFTDISAQDCLKDWLHNVSPTGTFVKNSAATWTNEQAGIPTGWTVQVEGGVTPEPEPERDYLCFTSTGDSTVAMTQTGTPSTSANKVIQYKLNNGQWQTWDLSAVTLHDGDKMYLKSDDEIPTNDFNNTYKKFVMTGSIAASGNIMSLLNFSTTMTDYAFIRMFKDCTSLTTAPELPATTLSRGCYSEMFIRCASLTQAPVLPATTLAPKCYMTMFKGCASLTQAPALPATTLTEWCYASMFSECTSLTQAPALPATTLADSCYKEMFNKCTSLIQAPALPATTLASHCYDSIFQRCTSLTKAPALPATTLVEYCYQWMFSCTSLTQAPELPATDLAPHCYNNMFRDCTNLNYVKAMFTTYQTGGSYLQFWLDGVSPTGTFVKNSAATWTNEQAEIPTGWTVQTTSPDK